MTPPPVPRIAVEGLTVRHVGRRSPALREVSLRWEPGERLLLLGPSGSGKSTLALCLNGIIPHSLEAHWEGGRVLVDGQDTRATDLAALVRRVAVLFQDPEAQLVMLEADDEIAFGLENLGVPRAEMGRRIEEARALVGLGREGVPARLDQLSGGMKQRVVLAALLAMAGDGGALVLDEPAALLDPAGAAQVYDALRRLTAGQGGRDGRDGLAGPERSLLLIEHRLDDVVALTDRVVALDEAGSVALDTTPDDAFGPQAETLERLGVWLPELAQLGRSLPGPPAGVPKSAAEAAALLAERWPGGPGGLEAVGAGGDGRDGIERTVGQVLLAAEEVSYGYGRGPRRVDGVSVALRAGELLALVGANGAGKSTLGLLLAGVLQPAAGRVLLEGRDVRTLPEREVRARVSYVFQYPEHQFVTGSVLEEVLFGLRLRGLRGAEAARRAEAALERFRLAHLAQASPYSLSHGQKRRLSVATALVTEPEVLILDEPTFGQDRRHTRELLAALEEVRRAGSAVAAITHDLSLVGEHADRVVVLARGRAIFKGVPGALFERPDVLAAAGLRRPPLVEAVQLARAQHPDVPGAASLAALLRALRAAQTASGSIGPKGTPAPSGPSGPSGPHG